MSGKRTRINEVVAYEMRQAALRRFQKLQLRLLPVQTSQLEPRLPTSLAELKQLMQQPDRPVSAPLGCASVCTDNQHHAGSARFLRQIALVELQDYSYHNLPHKDLELLQLVSQRWLEAKNAQVAAATTEDVETVVRSYLTTASCADLNFSWIRKITKNSKHESSIERINQIAKTAVESLVKFLQETGVDGAGLPLRQLASLAVFIHQLIVDPRSIPLSNMSVLLRTKRPFLPSEQIFSCEQLSCELLPLHVRQGPRASSAEPAMQAIASPPVTCQLCHIGLKSNAALVKHCKEKHGNWAEYRKRLMWQASQGGLKPLLPWLKRNLLQNFAYFQQHSVPGSANQWTDEAGCNSRSRQEVACVVCAVKDWLEARFPCFLFADGREKQEPQEGLLKRGAAFCFGPANKIDKLLAVHVYHARMPSIPLSELHASSLEHPESVSRGASLVVACQTGTTSIKH